MKKAVVFCLIFTFAVFQPGDSLQCYSCPAGSTQPCEVTEECTGAKNSCLKLKHEEKTYTSCVNFDDCNFDALSLTYVLPHFKFSCCQSNLCNRPSFVEKIKNALG